MQLEPPVPILLPINEIRGGPTERAGSAPAASDDAAVGEHRRTYARPDGEEDRIGQLRRGASRGFGEQSEMSVVAQRDIDVGKAAGKVEAVEIGKVRDPAAGCPVG